MEKERRPGKRTVTLDFPNEVYRQIKTEADQAIRSFGGQVLWICKEYFEQRGKPIAVAQPEPKKRRKAKSPDTVPGVVASVVASPVPALPDPARAETRRKAKKDPSGAADSQPALSGDPQPV